MIEKQENLFIFDNNFKLWNYRFGIIPFSILFPFGFIIVIVYSLINWGEVLKIGNKKPKANNLLEKAFFIFGILGILIIIYFLNVFIFVAIFGGV